MKIPKAFQLFGQEITVKFMQSLVHEDDAVGLCVSKDNEIRLQPNTAGHPMKEDQIGLTYYHELVHTILLGIGEKKLSNNDQFVDLFAQCLYQHEKTKTGELK